MKDESANKRQMMLTEIYQSVFPVAARYIAVQDGDFEEARDIFQDALIAWYEQKYVAKSASPVTDQAYIMGIVKNLWRKKQAKNSMDPLSENHEQMPDENEAIPSKERLLNYLSKAGKRCMELLQDFYYEQTPLSEIAQRFGFSGIRSATVQKYKCLEKVRETIKEKSLTYEDFMA